MLLTDNILDALEDNGYHKKIIPVLAKQLLKDADPLALADFAVMHLYSPWPEAEPIIATDVIPAFRYAKFILKGEFPEAEPTIATNGRYAASYANTITHKRFKMGEPAMRITHIKNRMDDMAVVNHYLLRVLHITWGEINTWVETGELPEDLELRNPIVEAV
jgi:hypothetical protein